MEYHFRKNDGSANPDIMTAEADSIESALVSLSARYGICDIASKTDVFGNQRLRDVYYLEESDPELPLFIVPYPKDTASMQKPLTSDELIRRYRELNDYR